ncbi:MAG: hypothetical protein PWP68_1055 [Rikenellaceae bacterium]|nr:hypothetical protein [Rikenellaceae bacterium]
MKKVALFILFQIYLITMLNSQEINQLDSLLDKSLYHIVLDVKDYYEQLDNVKKSIHYNFYIILDNTLYGYDISQDLKKLGVGSSIGEELLKKQNKTDFSGIRIGEIILNGDILIFKFYLASWKFNVNDDLEGIVEKSYKFTYKYSPCTMRWELLNINKEENPY